MDPKLKFHYAVIPLLYYPAFYLFKVARRAHDIDFGAYYTWAYGIRHGINPYVIESIRPLFDWLAIKPMAANYPPTFILAFEPLTYLSIEHAFALWSAINFALLLAAIGLLFSIVKPISRPILFGVLRPTLFSHRKLEVPVASLAILVVPARTLRFANSRHRHRITRPQRENLSDAQRLTI